jgi:hypothetical protein
MKKKFIGAIVLASLALWSVPLALASSPQMSAGAPKAAPTALDTQDHSCCPGVHSRFVRPLVVVPSPAEVPCEQHPCCVRTTPQNSAALPAARTTIRPGSDGVPVAIADQHRDGQSRAAAESTRNNLFQSYFSRSTVLRI